MIEERSLPVSSGGILVEAVGGPARRSGLKPGDVILAVDGRAVGNVDELERALPRLGGVVLGVERDGRAAG